MNSVILLNAFPDKKIKSLGNKGLIKISHDRCLIDYHINLYNKIYHDLEIIVVAGFESKKLHRYMTNNNLFNKKYQIKYIEHEPKDIWNIGKSILEAIKIAEGNTITIVGLSTLIDTHAIDTIKKNKKSFVLSQSGKSDSVGCCVDENGSLVRCYYGLENEIYDFLYLDSSGLRVFNKALLHEDISKLYLFEIINLCISNSCKIKLQKINKKLVHIIDSIDSVETLNNKYKKYA